MTVLYFHSEQCSTDTRRHQYRYLQILVFVLKLSMGIGMTLCPGIGVCKNRKESSGLRGRTPPVCGTKLRRHLTKSAAGDGRPETGKQLKTRHEYKYGIGLDFKEQWTYVVFLVAETFQKFTTETVFSQLIMGFATQFNINSGCVVWCVSPTQHRGWRPLVLPFLIVLPVQTYLCS